MSLILNEERSPVSDDDVRYYFLVSELRRCAMYVSGGCFLNSVLFWFVAVDRELSERIYGSAVSAVIAIWMSQFFLLARVNVDRFGVSRRVLLWWDLWPWEAFADGRIQHAERRSVREYRHSAKL